jgi:signal transduction histidine kinase
MNGLTYTSLKAELRTELRARKRAEEKVRRLSAHVMSVQDHERRRIARDLHDAVGQTLAAMKMGLAHLQRREGEKRKDGLIENLNGLTDQALRELRTMLHSLHPPSLDKGGLTLALRQLAQDLSQCGRINIKVDIRTADRFSAATEIALYRVLQESLTNICRHSGSHGADIRLEKKNGMATLSVRDYGKGISQQVVKELQHLGRGTEWGWPVCGSASENWAGGSRRMGAKQVQR